ncbi:MAG: nucleotidyltransferase domain-containing protein [Campylobacterales bacterium]|nr:nucleotidyltransferase domain-containing protein [Campylobacterales bacterium]
MATNNKEMKMILNQKNILMKLKELKPVFESSEVKLLGLFGSYARDEAKEESDIDILIETTPTFLEKYKGFKAHLKLDELKEILKQTFEKNIDLVDKQGLLQHHNHYILDKTVYV